MQIKPGYRQTNVLLTGLIAGAAIGRCSPVKETTEDVASRPAHAVGTTRTDHAGQRLRHYKRGDRPADRVDVRSVLNDLASTDLLAMVAMVHAGEPVTDVIRRLYFQKLIRRLQRLWAHRPRHQQRCRRRLLTLELLHENGTPD